MTKKFQKV